ncbi:hypothetical protein Syun_007516 [Stephania yunnanensis]|uniref:Pentatricopeptide repeat-containing protein n=1 Tax=Stephania yunnanensis TaxID=152371 RepID=A0AAP0L178_9MAGN
MLAARRFPTAPAFRSISALSGAAEPPKTGGAATTGRGGGGRETLGKQLLSLVYPKRSAVVAIRKWKEQGRGVRKYELNRVVRELRKLKRYRHALEICEWMKLQQDIQLLPGDYAVHLDLVAKVHGLASAEKFFEDLPEAMVANATSHALLHTYVRNNMSAKAEALMKKMSESGLLNSPLPYNHMLSLYISNGQLEKVPAVIHALKKNTSPDVVTYNLWLDVCASQNDVENAENVLLELRKSKVDADWVTYSTLTSLYVKNDLLEKASCTLKEMEKRVTRKARIAYSSLLSLHTSLGDKDGVYGTWKKIKSTFRKMNDAEYTCFIASLVKLEELEKAEEVYAEWESLSGTGDSRVSNILLAAYINKDEMDKADDLHNRMVQRGIKPSYTTWELLTRGYLKRKKMDKVLEYFKKATESVKKWEPNDKIVREVYKNLESKGDIEGAENLLVILRKAGYLTTEIYKSLLRTYAKAGKMPPIVAERMKKDKVQLDEETQELIKLTSKLCVSEVSCVLSW